MWSYNEILHFSWPFEIKDFDVLKHAVSFSTENFRLCLKSVFIETVMEKWLVPNFWNFLKSESWELPPRAAFQASQG